MTDPQIALMMLGLFILLVFLGFPIAFTLMAMGIGFGYYAYFDDAAPVPLVQPARGGRGVVGAG